MTSEGAKHFANAILTFSNVQALKLSLAEYYKFIHIICLLKILNISSSNISTEGARAIGNIFEKLLCLENLSFSLGRLKLNLFTDCRSLTWILFLIQKWNKVMWSNGHQWWVELLLETQKLRSKALYVCTQKINKMISFGE